MPGTLLAWMGAGEGTAGQTVSQTGPSRALEFDKGALLREKLQNSAAALNHCCDKVC